MNRPATAGSRVLFVDDAQIATSHGVERRVHVARKHEGNPVVTSDEDWEAPAIALGTVLKDGDTYRMWYQSRGTAPGANEFDSYLRFLHLYAESQDGLTWTKPSLGLYESSTGSRENNITLLRPALMNDMNPSVLRPPSGWDGHAYAMLAYGSGHELPYNGHYLAFSEDGIRWTDASETPLIPGYPENGWFTYDEQDEAFRGTVVWDNVGAPLYTESADGIEWTLPRPAVLPDDKDREWAGDDLNNKTIFRAMPIFRYGPVLLGFLQVLRGREIVGQGLDGDMDVELVSSRDGKSWQRVEARSPILERGEEESWDSGLVWTGNSLALDDDRVVAYYTGCERSPGTLEKNSRAKSIGMAWWPRDRFAGLFANGDGAVETSLAPASGELHVNADASSGSVVAELVGEDGAVVEGFGAGDCVAMAGADSLDHIVRWQDGAGGSVDGRTVSVRLRLKDAEVFSVWWE